jgi:pimeloyl-ACP methyl ester carboxylesterase
MIISSLGSRVISQEPKPASWLTWNPYSVAPVATGVNIMRFRSNVLTLQLLAASVALATTAAASEQRENIENREFRVVTPDNVSIHVREKARSGPPKVPVLLVHGTWSDSRVWDFPGRSVMDYLASRGHDTYALDLRGMGNSDRPADFDTIGLKDRFVDVATVATYIAATTGRKPVVAGWSQGGVIVGLLAARAPDLIAGVGLFSVPGSDFQVPPAFADLISAVSGLDRYLPDSDVIYGIGFGIDPITGKPTMSADAFETFYQLCQPDSVELVTGMANPELYRQAVTPLWSLITVPALVVDGALDLIVGEKRAQDLFDRLGSRRKELVIYPRNAHAWFLEDNSDALLRTFGRFLAQF